LTLDDKSGDDVVYRLFRSDNTGTQRIDVATDLSEPALFVIKHSTQGKGLDAVDRHLVQISDTQIDTNGKSVTFTLNVTLSVPRNVAITKQLVYDRVVNMCDFLTDGQLASVTTTANLDSLLRGEA
jgi:hypothetical protein